MCGIYASIGFKPEPHRIDMVQHRGPDGRGWNVFGNPDCPIALGHRRLSIIDLSESGHQPMADPTQRYHLTFNGEIYNHIELRLELEARGEIFYTKTDSEVLLRLWTIFGRDCLSKLKGMFAFIIWDEAAKSLFAIRDPFGIKPLYFARSTDGIAFASEIKQLLDLPGIERKMNSERVRDFLEYGISDHTSETMFRDVQQLNGGQIATVKITGSRFETRVEQWASVAVEPIAMDRKKAANTFRNLLEQSIEMHLRSDVPVGSCLSGGLDSSSIVALINKQLKAKGDQRPVSTVSACFSQKSVDEKPYMMEMIEHAETQAYFVHPRAEDVFALADQITWHQDEPFGSTSIFAQWSVFETAKNAGLKVMLDGQGADEQLAGYHTAIAYHLAGQFKRGEWKAVVSTLNDWKQRHGTSLHKQLLLMVARLLPRPLLFSFRRLYRRYFEHDWSASEKGSRLSNHHHPETSSLMIAGLPQPTDLASLCVGMTYRTNLPMLLHWEDRNSMAHSIEARVPFLDPSLVAFSLALGNHEKMIGGTTKSVLRDAMGHDLPERVRNRSDKLGFATPEAEWMRGPLRGLVEEGISATIKRYPGLLNEAGVNRLAKEMLDGKRAMDFKLWRIISLGIWGKRFEVSM